MKAKRCFKCGKVKPLSEYYVHSRMGDGHLNKCKTCTKKDTRENRDKNIVKYIQYDKDRLEHPHRQVIIKKAHKKWDHLNKFKKDANHKVYIALKKGTIKKLPCAGCGNIKVEAHHPDYNYPLTVIWLCDKCHKNIHKEERKKLRMKESV